MVEKNRRKSIQQRKKEEKIRRQHMWLGYKKYSKKKTSMSYIEKGTGIL